MQKNAAVYRRENGSFFPYPININVSFIMKMSACFMVIIAMSAQLLWASHGNAQGIAEKKITLELKETTLREALKNVESLSGFRMTYPTEQVVKFSNISLKKGTRSVSATLDMLLEATGLDYKQVSNSVILFKKEGTTPPATSHLTNGAQQTEVADGTITGKVTDESGNGIPGVTVAIKGTTNGTFTDGEGTYQLRNVASDATLIFSIIGFETQEVALSGRTSISVTLQESAPSKLNEIVVIGYGTTTRRTSTGSVSRVSSKSISEQPVTDPVAALQGRIPGLFIASSSGLPGSNFKVQLRGINSIGAGTDPLYIVDGVPVASEPLNQFPGANGNQSPLASINPNDIESIDVLKDADATAIYGSRGANGVVLITTKKGKGGKTKIDANVYSGAGKVTNTVDMMNTAQYRQMRKDAYAMDEIVPTPETAPDLFLWDSTHTMDWQKDFIGNTAKMTDAQLSVSGGNETTRFLVSGSYHKETAVLPGSLGLSRGALHFNLDHSSKDGRFNITFSGNYSAAKDKSMPIDMAQYFNTAPNYPGYDSTGKFYYVGQSDFSPYSYLKKKATAQTNNLVGNSVLRYTILPGLNVKASLGYNTMDMEQVQTNPESSFNPLSGTPGISYYGNTHVQGYIVEPQIDYTRKLAEGTLQILAGASWQQTISKGSFIEGRGFDSDEMMEDIKSAESVNVRRSLYNQYNYQAVFGRINYNWREKYIVNATFRRDGSSRFGPENRFGNFGAVGAAWLFSNEPFVKSAATFLTLGKLRASYGVTGNDQIGDYQYLPTWGTPNFPYDGSTGLTPSRLYNAGYGWERNKKMEAGIDLGFLDERILLTTNYYRNRSDNLLVDFQLSAQTGFPSILANLPALVQNTGWEFDLNTTNVKNENFAWNTTFNITFSKNKLLEYPDLAASPYAKMYDIGQSLSIVKGFHFLGVDPKTGIAQFQDVNADDYISEEDDMVTIGKTMPDFYGGFHNNFTYKNWSLAVMVQFVKQEGFKIGYGYQGLTLGERANAPADLLGYWRQPDDITDIPRPSTKGDAYDAYRSNYRVSDAQWGDASYIRLKNVSLSYNLSTLTKKWNIDFCRIYLMGQNLLTFTKYKGMDPETQNRYTPYNMPPLRVITAGIQITL